MTVNIHKGFTFFNRKFILHELREAVRQVGADVVFMQEVAGTHATHPDKFDDYPETPHYAFLADSIWPDFAYGRNAVYTKGHHGNAVMSKFPILQYENQDVSISGPERRGLLHCVLEMPDQRPNVHAICVHLGLLASHRRQQIDLLCEMASRDIPADAPLIVAGDFNDWRVQAHDQLAQGAGLHEVFVQSLGRAARTFPARAPLLRLDRIYVRNAVGHAPVVLPRQPWAHLSDHAPLAAEIELWRDSSADMARASRRTATDRLLKFPVAQGLPSRPVLDSWFYPRVFAHPRPRCAPTHDSCPNG